jgi:hypothetical protein
VASRDKTHFTGKGKIKEKDPASLAVTCRIIYIPFRTDISPWVITVNLQKIFIYFLPLNPNNIIKIFGLILPLYILIIINKMNI